MKSLRWMASYILVAALGLWLSFFVSMKFMTPAHSQEAPSSGDLPAEFMQDLEKGAGATPPTGQVPASPGTAGAQPAHEEVPVYTEAPIGDGVTAPSGNEPMGNSGIDGYVYDPTGKRDPFKPFKAIQTGGGSTATAPGGASKAVDPLQRWDLDRLQIVGILWEVNRPRAMVRDPDGGVYTVLKNSKIGRNEGVVTAIREGEIVVVETFYVDGATQKESKVMEFRK